MARPLPQRIFAIDRTTLEGLGMVYDLREIGGNSLGVADACEAPGHLVTCATEHAAVLD